jgi:hypothetical protein
MDSRQPRKPTGAPGRAGWHGRGQGFESPWLHSRILGLTRPYAPWMCAGGCPVMPKCACGVVVADLLTLNARGLRGLDLAAPMLGLGESGP